MSQQKPASLETTQYGGSHYKGMVIEPAEYIHKNGINFLAGNAIKYASRYEVKNGAEDVKKAIHYLQMVLDMKYDIQTTFIETALSAAKQRGKKP